MKQLLRFICAICMVMMGIIGAGVMYSSDATHLTKFIGSVFFAPITIPAIMYWIDFFDTKFKK